MGLRDFDRCPALKDDLVNAIHALDEWHGGPNANNIIPRHGPDKWRGPRRRQNVKPDRP